VLGEKEGNDFLTGCYGRLGVKITAQAETCHISFFCFHPGYSGPMSRHWKPTEISALVLVSLPGQDVYAQVMHARGGSFQWADSIPMYGNSAKPLLGAGSSNAPLPQGVFVVPKAPFVGQVMNVHMKIFRNRQAIERAMEGRTVIVVN
jgi:hypothetical protein